MDKKNAILRNFLWLGFTLLVLFVLIKLSFWQYARGIEKEQRSARITELNQGSSLSLNEVVELSQTSQFKGKESINDLPVSITGNFNSNFVFLLDNQVENRSLGYRVIQVISTDKHSVLVNLGWVMGSIDRSKIPDITPLSGQHLFKGHIRIVEQGIMLTEQDFSNARWPLRVQQIEIDKFSILINKPLLPFIVYVAKEEVLGYKKNWNPIVMPAEKHFAYAFQWAALALTWLVLMLFFKIKKSKVQREATLQTLHSR